MNKAELINSISEKTGHTQLDTLKTLDALLETIEATVAGGDKVQLVGFGIFEPQHRAARAGRNPQTGEPIEIAEATLPKFTPGKLFKDKVVEAHKPKPKPASTGKAKAKTKTEATTTDKAKAKPKKV
ncbi:MAG: DNA-binding protein [Candidatus Methylumidiphilus alinenensis]|uniref:DNA-binding protein n=1 Tax=Candidatus Methylumidiphilus alinenensis TaxID=2202197 RepID=A0A2W4TBH5_9GAMM|nr:MAG: DNA-binding protein [Candidatus Methylumidiphilus alinenensis]